MSSILSYQCLGLRRKPYKVLLSSQNLFFCCAWITKWRSNNSDFFRREVPIAECVFDIVFIEGTFLFNSHAEEEAEGFGAEHVRILLRFGPDTFFMISNNNDVRLGPEGKEVLVIFDGKDAHGGNGSWAAIFLIV